MRYVVLKNKDANGGVSPIQIVSLASPSKRGLPAAVGGQRSTLQLRAFQLGNTIKIRIRDRNETKRKEQILGGREVLTLAEN